jgi:thiamine-phosphate pyrophosphorylase
LRGRDPAVVARQLCEGGSDLVQLRAKGRPPQEVRQIAREIQPVLHHANVGFVINDHWEIARELGADFCHLGQEDFFDAGRTHLSQLPTSAGQPLAGLSTHAPEQAQRALAAQPAYLAVGPIFATGTKPEARPVTLDYVRWAAAQVDIPWFAIGGINLRNLEEVLAAGAERICVVSAILNADDIAQACREFRKKMKV